MHHDPAVEAEFHVEIIDPSIWSCVFDEIVITLGLTGSVRVSFCFSEIVFCEGKQTVFDLAVEVLQVRRVALSASTQDHIAFPYGRMYVLEGVVWCLRGQFSTNMVSCARTPARPAARSPVPFPAFPGGAFSKPTAATCVMSRSDALCPESLPNQQFNPRLCLLGGTLQGANLATSWPSLRVPAA